MASITKKSSCSLILFATCSLFARVFDQSVAVVGAHVVTLRDVRVQSTMQYIFTKEAPPSPERTDLGKEALESSRRTIVTDWLIVDYLTVIQGRHDVKSSDVQRESDRIWASEGGKVRRFLEGESISIEDVRTAVERKLRFDDFIENQLGFRVSITDEDIQAHYEKNRSTKFLSKPFEAVRGIVREDLRREKVQSEFGRWMDIQTRRTEVTLLPMRTPA